MSEGGHYLGGKETNKEKEGYSDYGGGYFKTAPAKHSEAESR